MLEPTEVVKEEVVCVPTPEVMVCGGYTDQSQPGEESIAMLMTLKSQVEERMNKSYDRFSVISLKTQVVAGINYVFTVSVNLENEPNEELNVRIFKPLPHTQMPPELVSVSPKDADGVVMVTATKMKN
jgi:hypothetical protein